MGVEFANDYLGRLKVHRKGRDSTLTHALEIPNQTNQTRLLLELLLDQARTHTYKCTSTDLVASWWEQVYEIEI